MFVLYSGHDNEHQRAGFGHAYIQWGFEENKDFIFEVEKSHIRSECNRPPSLLPKRRNSLTCLLNFYKRFIFSPFV